MQFSQDLNLRPVCSTSNAAAHGCRQAALLSLPGSSCNMQAGSSCNTLAQECQCTLQAHRRPLISEDSAKCSLTVSILPHDYLGPQL